MNNTAKKQEIEHEFDFDSFFLSMKTKSLRKSYSIVGNQEDAEDAFQNACLNFFRFFHNQFRRDADPKSWFYRILVNESLMVLRVNKRRNKAKNYVTDMEIKPSHYLTDPEYMIIKQDFRIMTNLVSQLPIEQKQALSQTLSGTLKRSDKNGHRDKSRSYRARMVLKRKLKVKKYADAS